MNQDELQQAMAATLAEIAPAIKIDLQ